MPSYFLVLLLGAGLAWAVTPAIIRLAIRVGAMDRPVKRSVHRAPVPHLGGVAIYLSFFLTLAVTSDLRDPAVAGLLVGGGLITALGVVDDFRRLSAGVKLLGQVGAALVLLAFGIQVEWVTNPLGGLVVLGKWGAPLTVLWVVSMVNVVNLIDGLDGLAAGITAIASLTLLPVALQVSQGPPVLLTAALAGSTLGFIPYNFNPARIFMGDAGAMFLGYTLAGIAVAGTLKSAATIAMVVPALSLGLPIFDTLMAIVRRFLNGYPIHQPDREHLHHRLLEFGLNHRQTVLLMYLATGGFGASAILLARFGLLPGLLVFLAVVAGVVWGARKVGFLDFRQGKRLRNLER